MPSRPSALGSAPTITIASTLAPLAPLFAALFAPLTAPLFARLSSAFIVSTSQPRSSSRFFSSLPNKLVVFVTCNDLC